MVYLHGETPFIQLMYYETIHMDLVSLLSQGGERACLAIEWVCGRLVWMAHNVFHFHKAVFLIMIGATGIQTRC